MSGANDCRMTSVRENVQRLVQDAVGSAKKRRQITRCLKKRGLQSLGKGGWLAFRGTDVVSGFLMEGGPLDTYLTTFVLPSFDKRTFISWSLGQRVVHSALDRDTEVECEEAISFYKEHLSSVRTSAELLRYIDDRKIVGHYPIWVRYLCLLRNQDFGEAAKWLDADKLAKMHQVELKKFAEIEPYVSAGDAQGVTETLNGWEKVSERIFGPFQQEFFAF
jgi:hypothetical protein